MVVQQLLCAWISDLTVLMFGAAAGELFFGPPPKHRRNLDNIRSEMISSSFDVRCFNTKTLLRRKWTSRVYAVIDPYSRGTYVPQIFNFSADLATLAENQIFQPGPEHSDYLNYSSGFSVSYCTCHGFPQLESACYRNSVHQLNSCTHRIVETLWRS
jgi:hypothetical protein